MLAASASRCATQSPRRAARRVSAYR
jgi:hypothetical protein